MARWIPVPLVLILAACGSSPKAAPAPSPSPTGEIAPVFPELTGDVRSPVRLLAFDAKARAVVVEPILFQTGPEYCAALHVSPVDTRCSREIVVDRSNTRVTLPLAARADFRDIGDGECLGTIEGGATCEATAKDMNRLAQDAREVVVTVRSGTVTRIAELYQP
ncbi:hypothetical protein [Actinoplanes sp. NPDC051494]|uniref:hypothetical protein n=1 Tax=Actinoplanes sp. NPDC051494 TaxID=3363907 RepID=UPI0037B45915